MKILKGNLITLAQQGEFNVIVHGCNCFNAMGAGIAKEIREKYPQAYSIDRATLSGDYGKLGSYTVMIGAEYGVPFDIVNAYTQYGFNTGTGDVFEYTSFATILQKLAQVYPTSNVGFPMIGCGLAGGDESIITGMIQQFSDDLLLTGGTVTVVKYSPIDI